MVCIYNAAPGINITYCIASVQPQFDMEELNSKKPSPRIRKQIAPATKAVLCMFVTLPALAAAQNTGYSGSAPAESESGAAQISLPSGQSPFSGSVAQGKPTPEAVSLTFQGGIDLGLTNHLRVTLQSYTH